MKTTIRKKLLTYILILLSVLYLTTGLLSALYVYNLLVERADRDNRQVLQQAIQQMDVIFEMCEMTARQVMTDENIERIVYAARNDFSEQKYAVLSRATQTLGRYIALNPFVANIAIITSDDMALSNQGVLMDIFHNRLKEEWMIDFIQSKSRMLVSGLHSTWVSGRAYPAVTLVYKYHLLPQSESEDCYLMIDIMVNQFRDVLQSAGAYPGILVTNSGGQSIVESDLLKASDLTGQKNQNDRYILPGVWALYSYMEATGWNIYYPIQRSEFNRPIFLLLSGFIGVYLLTLLVSILLLSRRISAIVSPVRSMTAAIEAASHGDLAVHTEVHSGDELEVLSDCFNKLVEDLRKHTQLLVDDEIAKKEMQMDLLMSQIHPHFVYNTLHSVVYLIEEDNPDTAIKTIYSLIHTLQYTVRMGSKEIFATISEEIELVRSFVNIAAVGYPGMFQTHIFCDSGLQQKSIPKVLIQPLVENAIYHGILPTGRPGNIWVNVLCENPDRVHIRVEDDGQGLDGTHLIPKGGAHGIGLINIRNRIQHLYSAVGYTFEIKPRKAGGTLVEINLPL